MKYIKCRKPYVFLENKGTDCYCLLKKDLEIFAWCQETKGPDHSALIFKVSRGRKHLFVYFLTYDCNIWSLALEIISISISIYVNNFSKKKEPSPNAVCCHPLFFSASFFSA
jgi:hypothetical protein